MSDLETAVRESASDFREFIMAVLLLMSLFGPTMGALFVTLHLLSINQQFIIIVPIIIVWIVALFVTDVAFKYWDED